MSEGDKLLKAWEYAQEHLAPDVVAQVAGLFTPQSLAMLAGFGAAYVAAQLTPVGWVADGIALATLTTRAGSERSLHPLTGLYSGFVKALARELPGACCRAISTDEPFSEEALGQVASELARSADHGADF